MAPILRKEPDSWVIRVQIQQQLNRSGRYSGPADGAWGPSTIKGIQITTQKTGTPNVVDGVPGPLTAQGVEYYATGRNLDWPNVGISDSIWHQFLNRLASVPSQKGFSASDSTEVPPEELMTDE